MIKRFSLISLIIFYFLFPFNVLAQSSNLETIQTKARVIKILEERSLLRENNSQSIQQDLELLVLEGNLKGQTFIFRGIGEIDVISGQNYKVGDRVLISIEKDANGKDLVYVLDYVRDRALFWLFILFIIVVLVVGKKIGWRSILALVVSFFLILKVLAPLILAGYNPIIIGPLAALLILVTLVYLTEGFNIKAHISVISIFFALLAALALSALFVNFARLSGTSTEETIFLISANIQAINFQGLLLAAIIIGALGVLDDIVVGQVESVWQLMLNNPERKKSEIFKSAMSIGRAHLGAIINTLFLAYVGASLPLVLLFSIRSEPFLSWSQVLNHEIIATEIVRTLVGVVALCLAMPIATFLAVLILDKKIKLN